PYGFGFAHRAGDDRHQPLAFPGQEIDERVPAREYNIFRWYDSDLSRYTQADPVGLVADTNVYAYVHERATGLTDPLGLMSRICCKLIPHLSGFRHCYVDMYDKDGNRRTWGLHEERELQGRVAAGAIRSIAGMTRGIVDPDNKSFDWDYGDHGET